MTEVDRSQGDTDSLGERDLSPEVINDVPASLKDLPTDELEVQSIHSQRLYTVSPTRNKKNKKKVVRNVR